MLKKKYIVKIYDNDGTYLGTIDTKITGFKMSINGGLGEMVLDLPMPFESFSQGNLVALNNKYDVYCIDKDTSREGVVVYSGYLYDYEAELNSKSKVSIRLVGFWNKLAVSLLRFEQTIKMYTDTATYLKTTASASAVTIQNCVKKIIDLYRSEASGQYINYSADSVQSTGTSMTYTFLGETFANAINTCRDFAPANWFFFIGADNILQFKEKPDTSNEGVPKHKFVLGKHFSSIKVRHSMEGIINHYLFGNNDTLQKMYVNLDSDDDYDDIWEVETDERVTVEATADLKGASKIAEYKDEYITVSFRIFDNNYSDNGYDIESILPGDTCSLYNLDKDTKTYIEDNIMIMSVSYAPTYVDIEVQSTRDKIGAIVKKLQEDQYGQQTKNLLADYTEEEI